MRVLPAIVVSGVLAFPASAEAAQRRAPYSGLFTGQLSVTPQPQAPAPVPAPQFVPLPPLRELPLPNQKVVCGMTVAQGDATIDPKMPQRLPANAPKSTIKIIPAPTCGK